MGQFKDQIIWITGASSGIGKALARAFANEDAHIILSGRNQGALNTLATELKAQTLVLPFDTADFEALTGHVETAWGWKGRVHILVNNAGISQRSLAVDTPPQIYTKLINVDLLAPIWLTQLQLGKMVAAGGAHIVAISSIAGRIGAPLRTGYSAAKHGLIGYMDALRAETERPYNIHVTNVLPGSIATNVARNALTADGSSQRQSDDNIENGADPADLASAILRAVQNNVPELIFAQGLELTLTQLRQSDPEQLFKVMAELDVSFSKKDDGDA